MGGAPKDAQQVPRESLDYSEGDSLCRVSQPVISDVTLRALNGVGRRAPAVPGLSPVREDEMRDINIDGMGTEGRWYRCVSAAGFTRGLNVRVPPRHIARTPR